MNCLPVKSQGRTVMTSDFVTILDGILIYSDKVWEKVKEREEVKEEIKKHGEERARKAGVIPDVATDGYYNSELCLKDFLKVREPAVPPPTAFAFWGRILVPAAVFLAFLEGFCTFFLM